MEGGYYSDPELECQAFQICVADSVGGLDKYSFLCPNGSLFHQQYFICDFWFNVDCSQAESLYFLNDEIDAERQENVGAVFTGIPAGGGESVFQAGARGAGGGVGGGDSFQGRGSQGSRGGGGSSSGSRGQQGGGGRGQGGGGRGQGGNVNRPQTRYGSPGG